jgi:AI-2E family transporter
MAPRSGSSCAGSCPARPASPITALIVLAIVIAVQQLEGHVLQPLIMGRAVALHPLAIILAIATGVVAAGIIGGLVAVPLLAVANTAIRYLRDRPDGQPSSAPHTPGTEPADPETAAAEDSAERAAQHGDPDDAATVTEPPPPGEPKPAGAGRTVHVHR